MALAGREPAPRERLRVSAASVVLVIAALGLTLALVQAFSASARVLGWSVAAALAAAFLYPLVALLDRWMPRGLGVIVVAVSVVGLVGLVTWGIVDDVRDETDRLRQSAPAAAARLEASERFGEAAREFQLTERTREFVDELPRRLQGGSAAAALRSAATRTVAFLASAVLTLFLLLNGRKLAQAALTQVRDPDRRAGAAAVAAHAYQRAWRYLAGRLLLALVAGTFAWLVATMADLPGPTPLALYLGAWSVVPVVGVILGCVPLVLLAAGLESFTLGWVLLGLFALYQVLEAVGPQRWIEQRSLHVGPVITVLAAMFGLDLYGIGGAICLIAVAVAAAAVVDELAPPEAGEPVEVPTLDLPTPFSPADAPLEVPGPLPPTVGS